MSREFILFFRGFLFLPNYTQRETNKLVGWDLCFSFGFSPLHSALAVIHAFYVSSFHVMTARLPKPATQVCLLIKSPRARSHDVNGRKSSPLSLETPILQCKQKRKLLGQNLIWGLSSVPPCKLHRDILYFTECVCHISDPHQ